MKQLFKKFEELNPELDIKTIKFPPLNLSKETKQFLKERRIQREKMNKKHSNIMFD